MRHAALNFLNGDPVCRTALDLAMELRRAGYGAWIVGGAVRDRLRGVRPDDYDLATTASPEQISVLYPGQAKLVGACFGVTMLERSGHNFEIATLREDRSYQDGRHPADVRYTADPAVDARRRDFTVNALFYDPESGEILDFVGGLDDLRHGILRCVGDARRRFREDYLRMLRLVRLAARMRFTIASDTAEAMRELSESVSRIAPERVRAELTDMLTGPEPATAIRLLHQNGLLRQLLPEVAALDGVEQPYEFHPEGDVFVHTMLMLSHMRRAGAELAWSVLLHDIGKAVTQCRDDDGRIRFFNHENVGADMAVDIARRLRFANEQMKSIESAVRRHMRFANVEHMKNSTLRKLLASPTFALEMELTRLDCQACHGLFEPYLRVLDEVIRRNGELKLPDPLVQGRHLVAAGFSPGPAFGKVLAEVYERQLGGEIRTHRQALQSAVRLLKASPL